MRAFHTALQDGKQKVPQCKLLVLGEPGVGKTSFVRHVSGLEFDPNLDPTRGIENQCITTMVDSAGISVCSWTSIDENEQAIRDHESTAKAIVDAMKGNPETETKSDDSDGCSTEDHITEDQLLCQINNYLDQQSQSEHTENSREFNKPPKRLAVHQKVSDTQNKSNTGMVQINPQIQAVLPPEVKEISPSKSVISSAPATLSSTTPSQPNPPWYHKEVY